MSDYLRETPAHTKAMELVHEHTLHRQLSGSNNLYQWDNGMLGDGRISVIALIHGDGSGHVSMSNKDEVTFRQEFGPDPEAERRYTLFRKSLALHGDYIDFSHKASGARTKENRDRYERIADALRSESARLYAESGVR